MTDLLSFAFTSMSSAVRRNNIYDLLEVAIKSKYYEGNEVTKGSLQKKKTKKVKFF